MKGLGARRAVLRGPSPEQATTSEFGSRCFRALATTLSLTLRYAESHFPPIARIVDCGPRNHRQPDLAVPKTRSRLTRPGFRFPGLNMALGGCASSQPKTNAANPIGWRRFALCFLVPMLVAATI